MKTIIIKCEVVCSLSIWIGKLCASFQMIIIITTHLLKCLVQMD